MCAAAEAAKEDDEAPAGGSAQGEEQKPVEQAVKQAVQQAVQKPVQQPVQQPFDGGEVLPAFDRADLCRVLTVPHSIQDRLRDYQVSLQRSS